MKLSIADAALLLLAASPATAWKHIAASDFRQALQNDHTLVAFVEPSLEASKKLDIEWGAVRETLNDDGAVVSIDCAQDTKLCDEFDVTSYPAIRLFHGDGRVRRYRGLRRSSDIVSFVRRALRPTLSYVDDTNITSLLTTDDVVFVARYASPDTAADDSLPDRFAKLARTYGDRYSFAVAASAGKTPAAASSVTCYNTRDDEQHASGDLSAASALDDFVRQCAAPAVVDLTRRNELQLLQTGKSLVHYFYRGEEERRAYAAALRPLAKTYREYLVFTTIDADEYGDVMLGPLGLAAGAQQQRRLLAVQNPSNGDVFPYTGRDDIAPAAVERFLLDIIQGAVRPWSPGAGAAHDEL